ncbi:Transglutaminase-like enzyme, putative cysteine protease [Pseudonocardia thermophila]|jgi:Transglutaminase-like enzymes, putative cysteine proteases|uniref:Transglutaminase-like enzyme, putative cysteine protease n=1 Tax=Pseudonocardia thermophila TaxID=1848 RepID=A0A1M7A6J4_PSETH|nr:transglutaminase family protein [Pseudonocardia thermophila]SHL38308.1 Transglutaminase-like enzyme, putative cysteine protease [Pseudonocardia thermophila]
MAGWRIRIVHETGYTYESPVVESYNEARMTPRSDARQNVIASRVETSPATRAYRYTDYWGTLVTAFDLHAPHTELAVTATSVVETADPLPPVRGATWEDLADEDVRDRFAEMLEFTGYVGHDPELAEAAADLRRGLDPVEAVLAAGSWVREQLTYQPGVTGVQTSALEAWHTRTGVCQDFVHLTLLLLREMGIPARYVSGYLLPREDTDVRETVQGESHAWVEAWTGGWWGYDPTNDLEIGNRHVWVAVGRDYADVPPLKGIFSGQASSTLNVSVDMTRLA